MKPSDLIREFRESIRGTEHEAYFREMERRNVFLITRVLGDFPSGRVLDAGASPAHLSALLQRAGCGVTAIDLYPDSPFVQDRGAPRKNLFRELNIHVVQHDIAAGNFPLEDNSFDAALFTEVLEHIRGNPLPALEEIRRVLRPGGRLYLTTPNVVALRNRLKILVGRNIYNPVEMMINVAPYKCHNREYTLAEVVEVVERAGLKVVAAEHHFFRNPPAGDPLQALLRAAFIAATAPFPSLRSNLFVVGEKQ
ncbi:MAG: class I SAM-dependent methyltransferase [bacterium]